MELGAFRAVFKEIYYVLPIVEPQIVYFVRNFRELEVWQDSIKLVIQIYECTRKFPDFERFGLAVQMNRSATSVPSNIAEGCSRSSSIEFARFLEIALGSSFELETQLEIARLANYIEDNKCEALIHALNTLQKRLNALRTAVKR